MEVNVIEEVTDLVHSAFDTHLNGVSHREFISSLRDLGL